MKKWSEVEQSKEYQSLPADQKETARNQYFSEIIAPQIPEEKRAEAKSQFDAETSVKRPQEEPLLKTALRKGVGYLTEQKKKGEEVLGAVAEPILQQATGMVAKPVSEIAGLAATGYEAATGGKTAENIPAFKEAVQQQLTYEPKTMAGRSEYNPLNVIPMAIGKAISAVTPEKAKVGSADTAIGMLKNATSEAIPQLAAIAGTKIAPEAAMPAKATAKILRAKAEDLMQSALKPTLRDLKSGNAAVAIDTMLDKGISISKSGMERIRARIDQLNDQIETAIASSPEKVSTARIVSPVVQKLKDLRKQVNPDADINALKKSWAEFKNHPLIKSGEMSVQAAQELKQGTYRQLSKKYGQMGSADVETQKAIARGLKEEIAKKVPAISALNLEESKLIKTLSVAERRILIEANKNPMGLSLLAGNPKTWAAFMADRSALFKSVAARMANFASKKLSNLASTDAAQGIATTGAVMAPVQTEKEKRKQYAMTEAR